MKKMGIATKIITLSREMGIFKVNRNNPAVSH